jgi:hypothetical protein
VPGYNDLLVTLEGLRYAFGNGVITGMYGYINCQVTLKAEFADASNETEVCVTALVLGNGKHSYTSQGLQLYIPNQNRGNTALYIIIHSIDAVSNASETTTAYEYDLTIESV